LQAGKSIGAGKYGYRFGIGVAILSLGAEHDGGVLGRPPAACGKDAIKSKNDSSTCTPSPYTIKILHPSGHSRAAMISFSRTNGSAQYLASIDSSALSPSRR
jgi:hypothetical protein